MKERVKEKTSDIDLVVQVKGIKTELIEQQDFKQNMISNNKNIFMFFFNSLSGQDLNTVEHIWQIINYLPVNKMFLK